MGELYPQAILDHAAECIEQLDEVAAIATQRPLSSLEFRAGERLLQLLIESGIGVAKHWLQSMHKTVPAGAYQCFTKLAQHQRISETELGNWKKMIGLRNALVHDYLNIDPDVITSILVNKYYLDIRDFIHKGCAALTPSS